MIIELSATVSQAETIEVPLPAAVGAYRCGVENTIPFDVGQTLDSVLTVSVVWSGSIVGGLGHGDGVERDANEWFSWPGNFSATMYPGTDWHAWSPLMEGEFAVKSVFGGFFAHSWDFLLDGEATVVISLNAAIVVGGIMVTPPQGTIHDAQLVIDYTTPVESLTWGRVKSMFR